MYVLKISRFSLPAPIYAYIYRTTQRILMRVLLVVNKVIPEEGLYVYNMPTIVKKHFCISIALF
jgi:hypothetical protein